MLTVPRFTDRQQRIQQNLQGLPFEFFFGVDKLVLKINQAADEMIYDDQKAKNLNRVNKELSIGEIACAISHRNIYAAMIENGWQRILIFEDDVMLLPEHINELEQALIELPEDWELLYLGYLKHEQVTIGLKIKQAFYKVASLTGLMKWDYTMISNLLPRPFTPHLKKAGFHDCLHAYAITLSAAKKLAAAQTPIVYRADDLVAYSIMKGEIKAFVTQPKFFDQQGFYDKQVESKIKT